MIKYRKVRGHKRIQKNIEDWKNYNLDLDLDYLKSSQRNYCKLWVSPFSDISMLNSDIPSPKGKNRKVILEGLLAIFNSWEKQLKTLNKPYYLAIWLFEPQIEKSQVVCATDQMLDFYNITFRRPEKQRIIPTQNYGEFKNQLDSFSWIYALNEGYFTQEDIDMTEDEYMTPEDYRVYKKWYSRKLKQNLKSETDEAGRKTYSYKQGTVWIGTKN